jgi:hypothetical protein
MDLTFPCFFIVFVNAGSEKPEAAFGRKSADVCYGKLNIKSPNLLSN